MTQPNTPIPSPLPSGPAGAAANAKPAKPAPEALRTSALDLAIQSYMQTGDTDAIIRRAKAFADFLISG